MNTETVEQMAKELMSKHNLNDWRLKWNDSKRMFGYCSYTHHAIYLSKLLTELNEEREIIDVILHEIAHALAPITEHHGKVWKNIARDIGCNATRCYGKEVIEPKKPYTVSCKYGHTFQSDRKPRHRRILACHICCNKFNHGKFAKKYKLRYKKNI